MLTLQHNDYAKLKKNLV